MKPKNTHTLLNELRQSIDYLDMALMFLLAERSRLVIKIGLLKKHHKIPFAYSKERANDLKIIFQFVKKQKLSLPFVKKIFKYFYDEALKKMRGIKISSAHSITGNISLTELRESIFNLDTALCTILAERLHLAWEIGNYKKTNKLPPLAPKRWQELLTKKIKMAKHLGVDPTFIQGIFTLIHNESLRIQGKINARR